MKNSPNRLHTSLCRSFCPTRLECCTASPIRRLISGPKKGSVSPSGIFCSISRNASNRCLAKTLASPVHRMATGAIQSTGIVHGYISSHESSICLCIGCDSDGKPVPICFKVSMRNGLSELYQCYCHLRKPRVDLQEGCPIRHQMSVEDQHS